MADGLAAEQRSGLADLTKSDEIQPDLFQPQLQVDLVERVNLALCRTARLIHRLVIIGRQDLMPDQAG